MAKAKASASPSPEMIAAAMAPQPEPLVGDGKSFAQAEAEGLIPADVQPTVIAENDPEGRQPGDPNAPIDLPDYLKEPAQPVFKAFVGDAPMDILDMEAEVAKSGVTVVSSDGTGTAVHVEQVELAPVVPAAAPIPVAASVQSRIDEEIKAGREALARKAAERDRVLRHQAEVAAKQLENGDTKPDDLTYAGNR